MVFAKPLSAALLCPLFLFFASMKLFYLLFSSRIESDFFLIWPFQDTYVTEFLIVCLLLLNNNFSLEFLSIFGPLVILSTKCTFLDAVIASRPINSPAIFFNYPVYYKFVPKWNIVFGRTSSATLSQLHSKCFSRFGVLGKLVLLWVMSLFLCIWRIFIAHLDHLIGI